MTRKELMTHCARDRDEVLSQLLQIRPEFAGQRPAVLIRAAIRSVCGYRVAPRVLLQGQFAVCDFHSRIVYYNTMMEGSTVHDNANIKGLTNSTLAHELGHIRLHFDEISERYVADSGPSQDRDSRNAQRENEADLYAAIFLVPGRFLVREREAQRLFKWHKNGRAVTSRQLWKLVFNLARTFEVTPTLMKRCLLEVGWIEECDHEKKGDRRGLKVKSDPDLIIPYDECTESYFESRRISDDF